MGDSAEIVRVEFSPAVISCDFDEMGRRLDEMLEPYEGMTPETAAGMDEKAAKACRADLNRMSRELNVPAGGTNTEPSSSLSNVWSCDVV